MVVTVDGFVVEGLVVEGVVVATSIGVRSERVVDGIVSTEEDEGRESGPPGDEPCPSWPETVPSMTKVAGSLSLEAATKSARETIAVRENMAAPKSARRRRGTRSLSIYKQRACRDALSTHWTDSGLKK